MSDQIFGKYAPLYFEKGISVTPLQPKTKNAFLSGWSKYHDYLPPLETIGDWCVKYPYHNIGLVLGKQSDITVVDVDSEDPAIVAAIESILPPTLWKRVGRKGYAAAYRWNGKRSRRIDDINGVRLVEVLSTGTQIVLPPSIHPDTGLPYTANADLLEVYPHLTKLPDNFIEQLIAVLSTVTKLKNDKESFNSSIHISKGSRDTSMNRNAGKLARSVIIGELSLKRAIDDMVAWAEMYIAPNPDDPLDIEKGVNQIIGYIIHDVVNKKKILPTGWDEGLTSQQKKEWGLEFTEEQREWSYTEVIEYLESQYKAHEGANNPDRIKATEFVMMKLHQSKGLTTLEIDRVIQFVTKYSGAGIPAAAYKRRLKEIQQGEEIAGVNHTEIAEAALVEFGRLVGEIRYSTGEFWRWDGSHWAVVTDNEIERVVMQNFGHLDATKKFSDITGVRKAMRSLAKQGIKEIDIQGVNFSNGFLTTELKLVPHNMAFGMTYTLPFRYMPDQAYGAHQFMEMLNNYWGHHEDFEDKVQALREAIGATIFGLAPKLQRSYCLYGVGGAGKSQILDMLSYLVPTEARSAIPPDSWGDTFAPAQFNGKLLNICGELDDKKLIPGKQFKEIVAGDEIEVRRIYREPFKFRPLAAHWFSTNKLPRSRDTSDGFNRRWLFFTFDKKITGESKVLDIGKKVGREEIESVAAWAIETVPALLKRKEYTMSSSHLRIQEDMSLQNSSVRQFAKDLVFRDEKGRTSEETLFEKYWAYAIGTLRSKNLLNSRSFSIEFEQLASELGGFQRKIMENGKVWYQGMGCHDPNVKRKDE